VGRLEPWEAGEPRRERTPLGQELVDEALDMAAMRRAIGELSEGARISDEVIDELLAGARTEEEIAGPAACSPS
jgi:hypothetical protein